MHPREGLEPCPGGAKGGGRCISPEGQLSMASLRTPVLGAVECHSEEGFPLARVELEVGLKLIVGWSLVDMASALFHTFVGGAFFPLSIFFLIPLPEEPLSLWGSGGVSIFFRIPPPEDLLSLWGSGGAEYPLPHSSARGASVSLGLGRS